MIWLKATLISICAIFVPIEPMLIAVGALVAADLIFGLMAAYKQKIPITSSGIRRTITKSFVYLSATLLGYVAEKYLLGDLIAISKLIAGTIGVVEMKSILESADIINGGSLFKAIVSKLGSENDSISKGS